VSESTDTANKMWVSLGFKASPYDARPLRPLPEDAELLVGREKEAVEFCTTLDATQEGVYVLSGPPGVGKTSFLNVQQYHLASGTSPFGPHLMAAEEMCTVQPGDSPRAIAIRVLESLIRSVAIDCTATGKKVPKPIEELQGWLFEGGGKGYSLGISIAGFGGSFGRTSTLAPVSNISLEGVRDAIQATAGEIVNNLGYEGCFVVLDNLENLEDTELSDLLMTFRDTLFMIPRVWWILIGQSGLASLIQTLDPRVYQRLAGSGLELPPLTFDELNEAIQRRVSRFSNHPSAKSPLPAEIHKRLYEASLGEARFVFKYGSDVCTAFVTRIRQQMLKGTTHISATILEEAANLIASSLVNSQIPEGKALTLLQEVVARDFDGLHLKPKEKKILELIAENGEVRAKDFEKYPVKSMQELSSNYLSRFHSQHLLARRQEGRAVYYSLRGIARMAAELGLLKSAKKG
jgi:hypothetical protein